MPQKFDRSKAKVMLLGKSIADNGIFPPLDSVYRDPRGPLGALIAIVDGDAEDALKIPQTYSLLTSDFYLDLLTSAAESGIIKMENIQSICPSLLSSGSDITLPLIGLKEDDESAYIKGLALFSEDKMTGTLNTKEAAMLLLLTNTSKGEKSFNFKVNNLTGDQEENYVNFIVRKAKRKLKVICDEGNVKAKLKFRIRLEIDEYSYDHLTDMSKVKVLTKKLENKLTSLAETTIDKLQAANNDSLGIGQKVKAYHHSTWKQVDWKEEYPKIPIEINFDVEIVRHGIVN